MDEGGGYFLHARTYAKTETRLPYSFLLNLKFASKHLMIAQMSCQHALAAYPRKILRV